MGIHKVLQRSLGIAFRPRRHLSHCSVFAPYRRLHACNEPPAKPSRRNRAGSFRTSFRMRNSLLYGLAVGAIGSRQMIEALPDAPRAAIRPPVRLGVGNSVDKLRSSLLGAFK